MIKIESTIVRKKKKYRRTNVMDRNCFRFFKNMFYLCSKVSHFNIVDEHLVPSAASRYCHLQSSDKNKPTFYIDVNYKWFMFWNSTILSYTKVISHIPGWLMQTDRRFCDDTGTDHGLQRAPQYFMADSTCMFSGHVNHGANASPGTRENMWLEAVALLQQMETHSPCL